MGINIDDLNLGSSLLESESVVDNIRELSSEELKITGGYYGGIYYNYYPIYYYPSTPSPFSSDREDTNITININNEVNNEIINEIDNENNNEVVNENNSSSNSSSFNSNY